MSTNPYYPTDHFTSYQRAYDKALTALSRGDIQVIYQGGLSFKVFKAKEDTCYSVELAEGGEVEGATCTCDCGVKADPITHPTDYHRMAAWLVYQTLPESFKANPEQFRVIGEKPTPAATAPVATEQPRFIRFCIECELMPVAHSLTDLCRACILDVADEVLAMVGEAVGEASTTAAIKDRYACINWKPLDEIDGDFDYLKLECAQAQNTLNIIGLLEYFFTGPLAIGGEYHFVGPDLDKEAPEMTSIFVVWLDSTKSRRDDIFDALELLPEYLTEGTPIRKTDRAGVGTKGTRKYQPVKGAFKLLAGEGGAL